MKKNMQIFPFSALVFLGMMMITINSVYGQIKAQPKKTTYSLKSLQDMSVHLSETEKEALLLYSQLEQMNAASSLNQKLGAMRNSIKSIQRLGRVADRITIDQKKVNATAIRDIEKNQYLQEVKGVQNQLGEQLKKINRLRQIPPALDISNWTVFPSVRLDYPFDGVQWEAGKTYRIYWHTYGGIEKVGVKLMRPLPPGAPVGVGEVHVPCLDNTGFTDMPVGGNIGPRILTVEDCDSEAFAEVSVEIIPGSTRSITLHQPDEGVTWHERGVNYGISWTSLGMSSGDQLRIVLVGDSSNEYPITASTPNDGYYSWTMPWSFKGGTFLVRISTVDGSIINESEAPFTITPMDYEELLDHCQERNSFSYCASNIVPEDLEDRIKEWEEQMEGMRDEAAAAAQDADEAAKELFNLAAAIMKERSERLSGIVQNLN